MIPQTKVWNSQWSRSRSFSGIFLLFVWSNGYWQFDLWFFCLSKSSLNLWNFSVHILLKPGLENIDHYLTCMWNECNCAVVWTFFSIAFCCDRLVVIFIVIFQSRGHCRFPNLLACSQCSVLRCCFFHLLILFFGSSIWSHEWNISLIFSHTPYCMFQSITPYIYVYPTNISDWTCLNQTYHLFLLLFSYMW